jgi:hypothetical protein
MTTCRTLNAPNMRRTAMPHHAVSTGPLTVAPAADPHPVAQARQGTAQHARFRRASDINGGMDEGVDFVDLNIVTRRATGRRKPCLNPVH